MWLTVLLGLGACDDASSSGAAACDPGAVCQCTKKSDCLATDDCVNNQCVPAGQAAQNTAANSTNAASTSNSGSTSTSGSTTGAGGDAGATSTGSAGAAGESGSTGGTGGNDAGPPAVVIVLDRSTSADQEFDDGASRWEAIVAALTEEDGPVEENAASAALGVLDYTGFQGGTCPEFGDGIDPQLDNYDAVSEYITGISLPEEEKSETPTREAIERGANMLSGSSGRRALILITDSVTDDTCMTFDNQGCVSQAYYAAQQAYAAGVRTYILGVSDVPDDYLQGVANAGTGQAVQDFNAGSCGPPNQQPETSEQGGSAPFWEATDTSEISSSLSEIFQAIGAD
ncbi:MAG TPA: hypothetical protein VI197_07045 [Polyangiaceae bacterium]